MKLIELFNEACDTFGVEYVNILGKVILIPILFTMSIYAWILLYVIFPIFEFMFMKRRK